MRMSQLRGFLVGCTICFLSSVSCRMFGQSAPEDGQRTPPKAAIRLSVPKVSRAGALVTVEFQITNVGDVPFCIPPEIRD